jgi:hypothetical protein
MGTRSRSISCFYTPCGVTLFWTGQGLSHELLKEYLYALRRDLVLDGQGAKRGSSEGPFLYALRRDLVLDMCMGGRYPRRRQYLYALRRDLVLDGRPASSSQSVASRGIYTPCGVTLFWTALLYLLGEYMRMWYLYALRRDLVLDRHSGESGRVVEYLYALRRDLVLDPTPVRVLVTRDDGGLLRRLVFGDGLLGSREILWSLFVLVAGLHG